MKYFLKRCTIIILFSSILLSNINIVFADDITSNNINNAGIYKDIGRNNLYSTLYNYSDSGDKVSFTENYTKLWLQFENEVKTFYDLLKSYNNIKASSSSNLALNIKDNNKVDAILKLKDKYDSWLDNTPIEDISGDVDGQVDLNKLKKTVLEIEFQSLKVQILGGYLLNGDKFLGNESSETEIKKQCNNIKTILTKISEYEGNDSNGLYNEILDLLESYDIDNDSYIEELKNQESKLSLLTEAFDLIDLWSVNPWTYLSTDMKDGDKIYDYVSGVGGFYSYLLNEYRFINEDNNSLSITSLGRNNLDIEYPMSAGIPSISTIYSQIVFNNDRVDSRDDYNKIFGGIFGSMPAFEREPYYKSSLDIRKNDRMFITGVKLDDGIDILDNYYKTLITILHKDTFKEILKNRYNYSIDENSVDTDVNNMQIDKNQDKVNKKSALEKWIKDEKELYLWSIDQLNKVVEFYKMFGVDKYTFEQQDAIEKSIEYINDELSGCGLTTLRKSNNDNNKLDESILNDDTKNYSILNDFLIEVDKKYYLNDDYKELFAWTSCFVPFQTNIYNEGNNTSVLSDKVRQKYLKYSKLRQPVSIIIDNNSSYISLIQNSVQKLEYCTLDDFIKASKIGDVFLFTNLLSQKTLSDGIIDVTKDVTEDIDGVKTTTTEIISTNKKTYNIDTANLTSSQKYFGPIYGSSLNDNYYSRLDIKKLQKNSNVNIFSIGYALQNPELANILITDPLVIENKLEENSETPLNEVKEGYVDTKENFGNKYSLPTILSLQLTPQMLYMNYFNIFNTLENGEYSQSGLKKDLNSLLYVDFLGNIITESGYVVIPAASNANRYTDISKYPIYNAMFINSYPDVKRRSSGEGFLKVKDNNKYVLLCDGKFDNGNVTDMEYKIGRLENSGKEDNVTLSLGNDLNTKSVIKLDTDNSIIEDSNDGVVVYNKNGNYLDINFITPHNLLKNTNYSVYNKSHKEQYVYSQNQRYPVLRLSMLGIVGKAFLNSIPPQGSSFEWLALTELNKNIYKLWEDDFDESAVNNSYINLNIAVGLLCSVSVGSNDTFVVDYQSEDADNYLKNDPLKYIFGTTFESIYNPFIGDIKINELLYSPTIEKATLFPNISLYIIPIVAIVLLLICIILIYMLATFSMKDRNVTISDLILSFILSVFLASYVLNGFSDTIDVFCSLPENYIMQDKLLLQALYELDKADKVSSNVFYSDDNKIFTSSSEIVIDSVTDEQALKFRINSGRPELNYKFYMPKFDNTKQEIVAGMYLRNNDVLINTYDLLSSNSIFMQKDADYGTELFHNPGENSEIIGYYMPYYHICESLVYNLNQYSKNTTNSYTLLNYDGITKVTGRCNSFFNSVFFIASEQIFDYINKLQQAYDEGEVTLGMLMNDQSNKSLEEMLNNEYTEEDTLKISNELQEVEMMDGSIVTLDAETIKFVTELSSNFNNDFKDWLGLKKVLLLSDDITPFDTRYSAETRNTVWYPNEILQKTSTETDEEYNRRIENKIYRVNNKVKKFIINNMDSLLSSISDQDIIKIISLKATFEFNKEFSTNILFDKSYPRMISSEYGNNDFITKTMYMPYQKIFSDIGNSLTYYMSINSNFIGIVILLLERILFLIRLVIRWISTIGLVILLFVIYINYILKNRVFNKFCIKLFYIFSSICLLNILEVLCYLISVKVANNFNLTIVLLVNITFSITLFIIQKILLSNIFKSAGIVFGTKNNTNINDRYINNSYYNRNNDNYKEFNGNINTQHIDTIDDLFNNEILPQYDNTGYDEQTEYHIETSVENVNNDDITFNNNLSNVHIKINSFYDDTERSNTINNSIDLNDFLDR